MVNYLNPDWSRAALVVIDVQRDFLDDGASPVAGTSEVVPAIGRLAEAFRESGRPIVHVVRLYEPGGSDVDLLRRRSVEAGQRLVAPGTPGSQIAQGVLRDADQILDHELLLSGAAQVAGVDEIVLFKPRWSAFHRTGLERWLLDQGCDTVVVAGCNLPNCPRATLFDASERDFRTALVSDAVSQSTPERLGDLERIGVQLLAVDDVVAALAAQAALGGFRSPAILDPP